MRNKLLKSTLVVSLMTSLSRLLGLVRDVIIGAMFGPGAGVDAFIVAFRIPNFLRRIFAEGGFSQAFVPVLSEYRERRSRDEVSALLEHTVAVLGSWLCVTTVIGVLAAPLLIWLFAPGFSADLEKQALAARMLSITFPYILFISLTAMAGGILNTYRRFAVPAFTPVLLNLSLIGCALWLTPYFPAEQRVVALAWGVLIAGVAQLLFQFPFLLKLRLLPRPRFRRDREGVGRIIKLMIPTLFAVSVTQVNLMVDTIIASFLETGSISWLYFSDRLVEFPLGVFGIALATVVLPSLAAEHAGKDHAAFNKTLDWALRWALLVALPASAGLMLLGAPLLTALFQYNEFSAYDVHMAHRSLLMYALGLPAFILVKVLSAGFFSKQDTKTPVTVAVLAMLANIVLNLALVVPLAHAGLALATSLSACLNAALLYYALRRKKGFQTSPGWLLHLGRIGLALAVMALALVYFVPAPSTWLQWGLYERAVNVVSFTLAGALAYFATLWLCGLRLRNLRNL
ncbi:MAG: murein biosynthesis integral membrane protein MurJ [Gammaproteobacteria bacterium]|nr:murein biosynthesis integral membrane protein MurJ [Gammaproteobacteria bacterium]MCY4281873.1 murein biosynthesis integral membrane protein MurJ [Gammaproteobacteria bacterium]